MYMPLLLFVIFLTVQASLLFLGNQAASAAAREASRVARAGGGSAQAIADATARGRQYAADVGHGLLDNVQIQVVAIAPDQVRVVPGIPGLTINQVAQGPVERFRPDV
jgi:Flp pilus assembly protein TadG